MDGRGHHGPRGFAGPVIVSADTDVGAILAKRQTAKPSFVFLRRTVNLAPEAIASLLSASLPAFESELNEGAILVITDTVIRVRRLPVTSI